MTTLMTLEEIKQQYQDEWLLIAYTELDENLNVVQGELLMHSPEVEDIYDVLPTYNDRPVAIEYVGEPPADVAFVL
jgi:hypothetical protein